MHSHDHSHAHGQEVSAEERLALLKYMVQHNAHHGCEGEAADLLHQAVTDIEESNKKIEAALKLLEG